LEHFGVWSRGGVGSIFPVRWGPVLQNSGHHTSLQTTTEQFSLTEDIKLVVPTDGFLSGVLESVKDSDNNFFRDFFLNSNEVLGYQRPEDVWARVCVPGAGREAVLRAAHGDSVLAGHPGIDQIYAAVAYAYYWPNLFVDVAHLVLSCAECADSKSSNQLRMGTESFSSIPLQPFTSWAMDLIGPLPATKSGHTWIVTWVDHTSKMIVAATAKERQIASSALALMTFQEVCCRFGLPLHQTIDKRRESSKRNYYIISPRVIIKAIIIHDVKFVSSLWQSLWNLYGRGTKL